MKRSIKYFEEKGAENTEETLNLAKERAKELGIKYVVVASTSGETGVKALELFDGTGIGVIVVTHQAGFKRKGKTELKEEYRKVIEEKGILVIGSDILTTVPKMITQKYGGTTLFNVVADTLRLFSQGMKVCIECAVKAADFGAVPIGEEIIAIAGTAKGSDTAIVLKPAHVHNFFDIDIREIIAIPRER